MSTRSVYISMIITAFFWSGAFIAGKMAAYIFSPLTLTCLRFLFALPVIFLLLAIKEPKKLLPLKSQVIPLLILGIIGTLGYHFFFFLALKYTTAINSSLIGSTNPMITTLLAVIFFKEKVNFSRLIGIGLSFLGVFSVITALDPRVIFGLVFNKGDILMTLGVLCFATYSILSRRFMKKYEISPLTATAYTFLTCTVLSFILGVMLENPISEIIKAEPIVWLEIIYMAILASVVGYYLQLNAINIIGAPKTAMFINIVPVFTIVLAALILKEEISILKFFSALLIIIGVYLATKPDKESAVK